MVLGNNGCRSRKGFCSQSVPYWKSICFLKKTSYHNEKKKIIILRTTPCTVYQVSTQNEFLQQLNKLLEMGRKGKYRNSLSYSSMNGAALMLFRILAGGTENINFLMKTQSVHSSVKILTLLYSHITF